MASTRMRRALQEYLNCPICLEPLKDAKILICGHSFCKKCIGGVVGNAGRQDDEGHIRVECPCCRKEQVLRKRSADELGSNFMANDIAEVLSEGDRNLPSMYDTCARHDNNERKYYCQRCKIPICSECGIDEHFDHGDRPKPMAEIEMAYKKKVARLLDESTVRTMGHSIRGANLKRIREEGCSTIDQVVEAMEEAFDERHMELSRARNQLYESIQNRMNVFCCQIDDAIQVNQAALDQVTNAKDEVRDSLKRSRPADLIQSYDGWKKKLKTSWDATGPSLDHAERELKTVKELSFKRFPVKGELWVGELVQQVSTGKKKTEKSKAKEPDHTAAGPSK